VESCDLAGRVRSSRGFARPAKENGDGVKVLITGQSGFIGQHLTRRLGAHEVIGLQADLLDFEAVAKEVAATQPELIIHLAARTQVAYSFDAPVEFSSINYVGTVNLIEAAKQLPKLGQFVFASTMETYGWQPESDVIVHGGELLEHRAFDEDTPQHPNAPYAVAKLGCERYLEYAGRAYGFPYSIIRQTNTYGRTDDDFFVVEQLITGMLRNPHEASFGNPVPYRNFLYIDDLLDLYLAVIAKPEAARGEVFCTGPANAISIRELAEIIAAKLGWQGTIHWNRKPHRAGEIYYLNSTHAKATRVLGWSPKLTLDEGLDRTIAHWAAVVREESRQPPAARP
jgi:UDP-glucose 4-epimerase